MENSKILIFENSKNFPNFKISENSKIQKFGKLSKLLNFGFRY